MQTGEEPSLRTVENAKGEGRATAATNEISGSFLWPKKFQASRIATSRIEVADWMDKNHGCREYYSEVEKDSEGGREMLYLRPLDHCARAKWRWKEEDKVFRRRVCFRRPVIVTHPLAKGVC
nr:leukotriene A-4 hydrolase homolog [Ipomoea batatas]